MGCFCQILLLASSCSLAFSQLHGQAHTWVVVVRGGVGEAAVARGGERRWTWWRR